MASFWCTISLLATLIVAAAAGRTPAAPPPSVDKLCTFDLLWNMYDCLEFMVPGSNQSAPAKSCCTGAKKVTDVSPVCLCAGQQMAKNFGYDINATRAAELPDLCKIEGPKGGCPSSSPSPAPAPVPAPKKPSPPAPAPVENQCNNDVVMKMQTCLDFVKLGSNEASPSSACCTGAQAVVKVSPTCLCKAMDTAKSMGIKINATRASELPGDCKIQGPPGGCKASGPAPAPPTPAPAPRKPSPTPSTPPPSKKPSPTPEKPSPSPAKPSPEKPAPAPVKPASPPAKSAESPAPAPAVESAKSGATNVKTSLVSALVGVAAAISFL